MALQIVKKEHAIVWHSIIIIDAHTQRDKLIHIRIHSVMHIRTSIIIVQTVNYLERTVHIQSQDRSKLRLTARANATYNNKLRIGSCYFDKNYNFLKRIHQNGMVAFTYQQTGRTCRMRRNGITKKIPRQQIFTISRCPYNEQQKKKRRSSDHIRIADLALKRTQQRIYSKKQKGYTRNITDSKINTPSNVNGKWSTYVFIVYSRVHHSQYIKTILATELSLINRANIH